MLVNETREAQLSKELEEAKCMLKRIKGLIGKKNIPDDYALIIYPCTGIHTFMMRFSIDVIFLNKDRQVLEIRRSIAPWQTTDIKKERKYAIEVKGGRTADKVQIGDQLSW